MGSGAWRIRAKWVWAQAGISGGRGLRRVARAGRELAGNIRAVADSFYLPLGDGSWRATSHTTGPWDPRAQHGGPPSALLGRAIQRCAPRDDMVIARFTCEILGAIPVGDVEVSARLTRPGRSVEFLEAVARAGGKDVARASAWRVLRTSSETIPPQASPPDLPPGPDGPPPSGRGEGYLPADPPGGAAGAAPSGWVDGYLSAVEWRPVSGQFFELGPATVWTRLRYPLVPDEEPSSLERVLAVADSGNGLSGVLDITKWLFINPELTVHLHREAAGEWICVAAQTAISAGGSGLATSVLSDLDGQLGVGAQALLISPRPPGPPPAASAGT